MKKFNIAIVNSNSFGRWFPEHLERLKKIGNVKYFSFLADISGIELAKKLAGYNIIISSVTPKYTKDFFENKDELLLISRHGLGYNNIDIEAAKEKGTAVSIVTPQVERDAVAENTITNLLSLVRRTTDSVFAAKSGHWLDRGQFLGYNIRNKTVGIIGCGNIGSRVAEIFKKGFNAKVIVSDPNVDINWALNNDIEIVDLETLFEISDFISVNASLTKTSYHILNKDAFSKMKKGVFITNSARGTMIVESDVLDAINSGIVSGLATDVMSSEPATKDNPYFKNNHILVTPHDSAYTYESLMGMGNKCVTDVEEITSGLVVSNKVC